MDFNKLKKPESKGVLSKKNKLGRPKGKTINATIRVGFTGEEYDKIAEIAAETGRSLSQTVRFLLKDNGCV